LSACQKKPCKHPLPVDAIDAFPWGTCPCGDCDTPTRVFITYQRVVQAEQGIILVQVTGVQSVTETGVIDERRCDYATVSKSDDVDNSCYCEEHAPAAPAHLSKVRL
jgi:hypothetical protein